MTQPLLKIMSNECLNDQIIGLEEEVQIAQREINALIERRNENLKWLEMIRDEIQSRSGVE